MDDRIATGGDGRVYRLPAVGVDHDRDPGTLRLTSGPYDDRRRSCRDRLFDVMLEKSVPVTGIAYRENAVSEKVVEMAPDDGRISA